MGDSREERPVVSFTGLAQLQSSTRLLVAIFSVLTPGFCRDAGNEGPDSELYGSQGGGV